MAQTALTAIQEIGGLLGSEKFSDVTFLVGRGKHQRAIPAHRVILASISQVFEAMLYPTRFPSEPDFKQVHSISNGPDGFPDEITLEDIEPSAFRAILQCAYSDSCEVTADNFSTLVAISNKYQVEPLRALCLDFLEHGINVDNACDVLVKIGEIAGDQGNAGMLFIQEQTKQVLQTNGFLRLPAEYVHRILSESYLSCNEVTIFKALLAWADAQAVQLGYAVDKSLRKQLLPARLLKEIRFGDMTMADIALEVVPSGLFSNEELLNMFTYLSLPSRRIEVPFNTSPRSSPLSWGLNPGLKSSNVQWSKIDGGVKRRQVTISRSAASSSAAAAAHASLAPSFYALGDIRLSRTTCTAWKVTVTHGAKQFIVGISRMHIHEDPETSPHPIAFGTGRFLRNGHWASHRTATITGHEGEEAEFLVLYHGPRNELHVINARTRLVADHSDCGSNSKTSPLVPFFAGKEPCQFEVQPVTTDSDPLLASIAAKRATARR